MIKSNISDNLIGGVIEIDFPTPILAPVSINFMIAEFIVIVGMEIEWERKIIYNDINSYFFEADAFLRYPPPPPPVTFKTIQTLDITDPTEGKIFKNVNDGFGIKRAQMANLNYDFLNNNAYKVDFGLRFTVTPLGGPLGLDKASDVLKFRVYQYTGVLP
jgi:hypothetical protein